MAKIRWLSAEDYQGRVSPRQWRQSLGVFLLAYLPLMFGLPQGVGYLLLLPLLTKWLPNYRVQVLAALLTVVASFGYLLTHFMALGFTNGSVTLLAGMAVAKMLESRNVRDRNVLFLLQMLLLLAALMYGSNAALLLYLFVVFGLSLRLLMDQQVQHRGAWKLIRRWLLLAFPFAVLMFFFFPRIPPLWAMPEQKNSNVTGLGEQMSMGDIASLAQSDEVVFRAKFIDRRPEGKDLYWRGPVLWHFDGLNWTQRSSDSINAPPRLTYSPRDTVAYEWTAVKNSLEWLTGLDVVVSIDGLVMQGKSYQMRMPPPGRDKRKRYQMVSTLRADMQQLDPEERRDALRLPRVYPQTQALAERLRAENGGTAAGFARGFLKYLSNSEFYYSLEPPPGMGDVEQFLFSPTGHIGFCEHYANAMAIAARSIKIPARVVTGYQGGEENLLNNYWVVREENAHAWVELYIDNRWQRFDPTAAVAPYRIQQARLGAQSLQAAGADNRSVVSRLAENVQAVSWLRSLWDATSTFWQERVVNFDEDDQNGLLEQLGLREMGKIALVALLVFGGLVLMLLLYFVSRRRPPLPGDRVAQLGQRLLDKWGELGEVRYGSESFSHYLRRLAEIWPAQEPALLALAEAHERYRYYEQGDEAALLAQMKALLKQKMG